MADGLTLKNVCIARQGEVLIEIDRRVAPGEILTVMGPSGSGKSTLLAYITGTVEPGFETRGEVWLNGVEITHLPADRRHVGILFQDDLLFPHLSVGGNLAFGLAPGGTRAERREKIEAALKDIELQGYADRDPASLSGGQKARVALMRMLMSEPGALLLDEAFSSLDAGLREQMRTLVFNRARELRIPVLMVTHDASDAQSAGGDVLRIGGEVERGSEV